MKREKMFALVEEWEQSQLTMKRFCWQKGIKRPSFSYWRNKYLRAKQTQHPAPGFHDIIPEPSNNTKVEVVFPSGARVLVPKTEVAFIRSLVQ